MDLSSLGSISFDWNFIFGFFNIVFIDILLAGDNAVVIALAVRSLPKEQRRTGIIFGAAAAVALRVILTFFVAQLLKINFLKLAGGALILWIAVKLFIEGVPEDESIKESKSLVQAIRMIVVADLTMATDNMLAVAGASHGNFFLLLFGLALSIPLVVLTSNLLSMLMDRYPIIIYIGAAILGRVGAEMIITDPFMVKHLSPSIALQYTVEAVFAVGVIIYGKLWMKWMIQSKKIADIDESTAIPETEKK